jgi:hypothetical protein
MLLEVASGMRRARARGMRRARAHGAWFANAPRTLPPGGTKNVSKSFY